MWIVMHGNPVDGFTFTGPFDDPEDANAWADSLPVEWWVVPLQSVEGGES